MNQHTRTSLFHGLLLPVVVIVFALAGGLVFAYGSNPNKDTVSSVAGEHWGWSDVAGWIDFPSTGSGKVYVGDLSLEGYASSGLGEIALDCQTAPGADCSPVYYVKNNKGGRLSGWAWNELFGWLSFCGTSVLSQATSGCPYASTTYQVIIDPQSGDFSQYAWNDIVGWVSFNSLNHSGSSTYKLVTLWRAQSPSGTIESVVFDTGIASGAQVNSLIWRGKKISGARIDFQIATDCATGGPLPNCTTWDFKGPSGGSGTVFPTTPNAPIRSVSSDQDEYVVPITRPEYFYNKRYIKYKMFLSTPTVNDPTPRVDQIFLNWSP